MMPTADIASFTAWSSVREPSQVFMLLEEIYNSFDAIAKKRRVFKVETIGDSYGKSKSIILLDQSLILCSLCTTYSLPDTSAYIICLIQHQSRYVAYLILIQTTQSLWRDLPWNVLQPSIKSYKVLKEFLVLKLGTWP
jgi:hypothetical protein